MKISNAVVETAQDIEYFYCFFCLRLLSASPCRPRILIRGCGSFKSRQLCDPSHNIFPQTKMSDFEMKMIDEVEEQLDLFDQILNQTDEGRSPIFSGDLSPLVAD